MKQLSTHPILIIVTLALAVVYAVASHMTLANAVFLATFVLLGYYLGLRVKGKK